MALSDTHVQPSTSPGLAVGEGLSPSRAPTHQARHLPGYIYASPEVLRLEKEKIFMKDWLCMARVEEIEKPGDYMTFRVIDEPVIIARDETGALNAFANVCRHRGVEVASGEGNLKEFSCPYHGWTYDLRGQLIGAPYMKEAQGFDPASCRLSPLRLGIWAGWIFVTLDDHAPPLEDFVAHYQQEFGHLRQEDCRLADKLVLEFDCNWKFIVENLIDVYHVATLHVKTIGRKRGAAEDHPFNLFPRGGTSMFYPSDPMVPGGESLFGNMPWLADQPYNYACSGRLSPNMQLIARADNVHPFVMWPLSPGRCRVINYTLFPKEHFDQPDFADKLKVYHDYMLKVLDEDRGMIASLQRNMQSRTYEPGSMSKLETGIHHVITDFVERLFGENP